MRILLLDDHPFALDHIKQAVKLIVPESELHCFNNVAAAGKALHSVRFDYVICDLQIVTGKNLEIPTYCKIEKIPFMVFSSHCNNDLLKALIKLNVCSYVNKASSTEDLLEGIRSMLSGKKYLCSENRSILNSPSDEKEIKKLVLTKMQSRILDLLDKGYDQKQISEKLFITKRTVQNHLAIIRNNNDLGTTNELLRSYKFWE
jgi:DNA-binding NarL/FixJ family response regulator